MRKQVIRRVLVPLLALIALMGSTAMPASAGEDKGMCSANHDRGSIPGDFPLDACFDGKTLIIKNGTQFPVTIKLTGNDVGAVQLDSGAAGTSSRLIAYIRPGQFGQTPVINSPDARSGIVPPGYTVKAPIGNGEAKVHLDSAGADIQKLYVVAEVISRFLPTSVGVEVVKAAGELVRELADVGDQYTTCRNRNNAWGDIGCSALLGRNVTFAFGRAAVNGLGGGVIKSVVSLFETASWAKAASGDLVDLRNGSHDFTIAAYTPPPAPKPTVQAPPPPVNNGNTGKPPSGNNGGNVNPPPPPQTATAVVQNMHLEGGSGLGEDSTPSYLSTVMQPRCASNGCKIGGTDMWSGATFTAICWDTGAGMTNENSNIPDDDNNPNRVDTDRWLKGQKNGQTGFISYIYVTPGSRSLNVGHC
jgi:hypothetical protein